MRIKLIPKVHNIDILRWGERFVYYFILFLCSVHFLIHHLLPRMVVVGQLPFCIFNTTVKRLDILLPFPLTVVNLLSKSQWSEK